MSFQPNVKHKRDSKSLRHAIQWTEWWFRDSTIQSTAFTLIEKHYGNQHREKGKYLRHKCLIEVDSHYDMLSGKCKKYSMNHKGIEQLKNMLKKKGIDPDQVTVSPQLEQELETGQFKYDEKSDRLFHPLQFKPKRIKRPTFSSYGYRHEYDIKGAVYTLIRQHADQLGYQGRTGSLDDYILNCDLRRQELSDRCGINNKQSKLVFTSIIQGSAIRSYWGSQLYQQLDCNDQVIKSLQSDQYLTEIKQELRDLWSFLKQSMGITTRITARDKAGLYRSLEKKIMREVVKFLKKTKNNYFLEHDGWFCREAIDITALVSSVRRTTGFVVELDWSINEYISE